MRGDNFVDMTYSCLLLAYRLGMFAQVCYTLVGFAAELRLQFGSLPGSLPFSYFAIKLNLPFLPWEARSAGPRASLFKRILLRCR